MSETCKDEAIIKLIGKISLQFPQLNQIDQLNLRRNIEEVLYNYDISQKELALAVSDIEEKVQLYIAVRKMEGYSERTLRNYYGDLMKFANYFKKPLLSISTMDIRQYLSLRCKNMQPNSVNGQIFTLKAFFSWLQNQEYIVSNPMSKIRIVKEPKRLRKPLTDDEVEIMRNACKTKRQKAVFEVFLATGCRLSEVIQLNRRDLDFSKMSFIVYGKGKKRKSVFYK
jgi:integrase/recombinase XerD